MNWKPQDCFAVRFSDETALDRTEEELEEMVDKLREVVNEYGFDLSCYGSWESMKLVATLENEMDEKYNIPKSEIETNGRIFMDILQGKHKNIIVETMEKHGLL